MKFLILDVNCSKCAFNMFLRSCDQAVYVPTVEGIVEALKKESFDVAILDGALASPNLLRQWKAECEALPPTYFLSDDTAKNKRAIKAGATGAGSKRNLPFVVAMFYMHRKETEPGRSSS